MVAPSVVSVYSRGMPAYDPSAHRQSVRHRGERGAWIYVPAAELRRAGIDPDEPPPAYRIWARRNGGGTFRLYGSRGH